MKYTQEILDAAINVFMKRALKNRDNAAYGGEMHDGGYSMDMAKLNAYSDGVHGVFPKFLEDCVEQAKKEMDPEYTKYLELKKKFG